jgi:DDE family transposase
MSSSPTPATWKTEAIEALVAEGIQTLVAPDADRRKEPSSSRRGGLYDFMRRVLATDHGGQLYAHRQAVIEPVFGQIKHNRGADRFQRRGRSAARSEWRLLAATHNILELWRHNIAAPAVA